jgi:RyR domain/TrkA-N domain
MARRYANVWSDAAAGLTSVSHTRASVFRWGVVIALALVWVGGGLYHWRAQPLPEAIYRTISAFGMWDAYFDAQEMTLQVVRFAALAAPTVGLLFAFSGQLGGSLARIFNLAASKHIVIAGDSPAALSLALDCRKRGDAVILVAEEISSETALGLRRRGVIVLEGDAGQIETLRTARADHAAHVVAFEADDTANLQIEAATRRLVGKAKRKPPIGVHVATRSPMLLKEAREMRSAQMRKKAAKAAAPAAAIDPKPFSLEEMAARALVQRESQTLLSLAAQLKHERVHIVFFGFDQGAEAVANALLKSLWSAHFGAPRLTVLAPNPQAVEAGFRARHREAFAHPRLWSADIAFLNFDWDAASIGAELLDAVEAARGKPSAAIVSTGADPGNIHLAIALKRACNHRLRWPIPIFMRESSQSEFSQQYAKGDDTPELDAYLQAFGAHQNVATRAWVIDGDLDQGAAIAHEHYNKGLGQKDPMSMRELQAAMRDWSEVLETYRAANRAVADAAMTKVWDCGWRRAEFREKGETSLSVPAELAEKMARTEHDRWMAERLMSGWRPVLEGEKRDNDLMAHDKLVGWEALNEADRANDAVQVRASLDVARMAAPNGFMPLRGS